MQTRLVYTRATKRCHLKRTRQHPCGSQWRRQWRHHRYEKVMASGPRYRGRLDCRSDA